MNRDTRRPFKVRDWRRFIERAERRMHGIDPDNVMVIDRANEIIAIQRAIPRRIWVALLKKYTLECDELRPGQKI